MSDATPTPDRQLDAEVFRARVEQVSGHAGPNNDVVRTQLKLPLTFDVDAAIERHCEDAYRMSSLLTRAESAAYLGVSLSRLSQHRRAGLINHQKNLVTHHVRYVFSDLLQLKRYRDQAIRVGA